jgi:glycosyltransferase involved in cell wall biosynthesis
MKNVLFFFENQWAFGAIHKALCKELFKYNIYANILDWRKQYTLEEIDFLNKRYDYFVTLPNAAEILLYTYKIDPKKIIIIAHEQTDILFTLNKFDAQYFDQFYKYCVISEILKIKSKEFGIEREPIIVKTGVHFDHFYFPINNNLRLVGYGGAKLADNFYGVDRKRGYLVEKCVNAIQGISLYEHKFYNHLCMPAYYHQIDCLIMSSLEDAGGLPTLEAAAAGKLVIGTPVGYFEEHGQKGGGILVPLEENAFIEHTKKHLEYYRDNSKAYKEKCQQIQQYAKDHYDWSLRIYDWVNILS